MRMWMVSPDILCRQHLLGEHVELHMFVGTMKKGYSIDGYCRTNLCEPRAIQSRHDTLVVEMEKRGYNHRSPIDYIGGYDHLQDVKVNITDSLKELLSRCEKCKQRVKINRLTKRWIKNFTSYGLKYYIEQVHIHPYGLKTYQNL